MKKTLLGLEPRTSRLEVSRLNRWAIGPVFEKNFALFDEPYQKCRENESFLAKRVVGVHPVRAILISTMRFTRIQSL